MVKERKNNRKVSRAASCILALLMVFVLSACKADEQENKDQIDLSDPSGSEGISTAAQLIRIIDEGSTDTLILNASIDLGDEMLKLDTENADLTIDGNGFTISGNGDCIIRLEKGCSLDLENVTLNAGSNAIGCLGDARISGSATIRAVANAIYAEGHVTIGEESSFRVTSNVGSGINATGLELEKNASLLAEGELGGVNITKDDLVLNAGAVLNSSTDDNYNALKCEGTLVMLDGSKLIVKNNGEYHGAEISDIDVEGVVTIIAQGGDKGVGMFLFRVDDEISVIGECTPELRFEAGNGSITFYKNESEFPTPTPEIEETPD